VTQSVYTEAKGNSYTALSLYKRLFHTSRLNSHLQDHKAHGCKHKRNIEPQIRNVKTLFLVLPDPEGASKCLTITQTRKETGLMIGSDCISTHQLCSLFQL